LEQSYVTDTMFDALKKTLLAGMGAAVITKDKAEDALAEFIKQGKVSAADAQAMARKLAKDGQAEYKTMSREVGEKLKKLTDRSDEVARARIARLEARLAALEKKQRAKSRAARSKPTASS
jgi:polyhydroxyalkanoate synthesis regulator phasin